MFVGPGAYIAATGDMEAHRDMTFAHAQLNYVESEGIKMIVARPATALSCLLFFVMLYTDIL